MAEEKSPRHQPPRRGAEEVARFNFDGFAFTLCISIRGRLEIEATDGKDIFSASFTNSEALANTAGSLSANAVFAFLRTGFSQVGGRAICLVKPLASTDSLVVVLTGQGILKSSGYSFRLPRGRRTSMIIEPSWADSLRSGNPAKNNPVIRYYEIIRSSRGKPEETRSTIEIVPSSRTESPSRGRAPAVSQVVVPDEEAVAAYQQSLLEAKVSRPGTPIPTLDSPTGSRVSSFQPDAAGSGADARRVSPVRKSTVGNDPLKINDPSSSSSLASSTRVRTISVARTKAESAFRTSFISQSSTISSESSTTEPASSIRHLYVDFRIMPQFALGPDIEIFVTLCSRELREHVTEPFFFCIGADGKVNPSYGGKSTRTVFRELPAPITDLILLVRVYRRSDLSGSNNKSSGPYLPRRPLGVGILDLSLVSGINRAAQDIVETINLVSLDNDALFWRVHDPSVVKPSDLKPLTNIRPFGVALTPLPAADPNPDAPVASQRAYDIIADTISTYPLQSVGDSGIDPNPKQRCDLYITLCDGQFALKKHQPIEICARLDPKLHPNIALRRGSGAASQTIPDESMPFHVITTQTTQPKWDETVLIRLPPDILRPGEPKNPLVLNVTAYAVGKKKKKEICKGQLTLVDQSGAIANGAHTVNMSGSGIVSSLIGGERASIKVRTLFVRTSSTAVAHFNRLPSWRTMRLDDLVEIIQGIPQNIADIPCNVIPDILDAFVGVLDTHAHDFVSSAVITAFCAVVGVCTEENRKQMREALDDYIDTRCTGMKYPERLYGAMAKFLEKPKDKRSNQILSALRALTYVSRICALSAFAQPDGSPPPGPALFKSPAYIFNLDLLLRRLIDIITSRDAELYSAQITALRGIPMLLDHVAQIVKARDAASLISTLLTGINPDTAALVQEKVKLIDFFARSGSPVLEDAQIRTILWPVLVRETIRHIKISESAPTKAPVNPSARNSEEEACRVAVVALHQLIDFAQSKSSPDIVSGGEEHDSTMLELLLTSAAPALGAILPKVPNPTEPQEKSVLKYDMAMAFLAILYVIPSDETQTILSGQPTPDRNAILTSIVDGIRDLLSSPTGACFPLDWDEMIQFQYRAIESFLAHLSAFAVNIIIPDMQEEIELAAQIPQIPAPSIGAFAVARTLALRPVVIPNVAQKQVESTLRLIRSLLGMMSLFVLSPQLDLDEMLDVKRDGLLAMADELSSSVVYSLGTIWSHLGAAQIDLLEHLMLPIIMFSLSKSKAQLLTAQTMLTSVASICTARFGEASRIVSLFLETLSRCFGDILRILNGTAEAVQNWAAPFVECILGPQAIDAFTPHLASVISLLYDVEMTPLELDIDERMLRVAQLIELLTFLGERRALGFHLSSLASLHLQCGTTVEAGYVMAALAEVLPWGSENVEYMMPHELVDASVVASRVTYSSRKIRVITEAMELLAMGAQWEEALAVSMPLAAFYDSHFRHTDYLGVTKKQLLYVEAMTDANRIWPSYWYIRFTGPAFPAFTQSSAFIIANHALESQQDMMRRLQAAYPSFPIIYGVGSGVTDSSVSRIDVCEVTPFSDDANVETEYLMSPSGPYSGADASVAHHRMRRRARHWRCTVREGEDTEIDYEFETLLSFPALIPRLPIVNARMLDSRIVPPIGRMSPPVSSVPQKSSPQTNSTLNINDLSSPPSPPISPSSLIPPMTARERPISRAGAANRAALQLSLPASQQLQQQISAAQSAPTKPLRLSLRTRALTNNAVPDAAASSSK